VSDPRSWIDRLVGVAVGLLLAALALSWAWRLLKPLLLPLGVGFVVVTTATVLWHRRGYW